VTNDAAPLRVLLVEDYPDLAAVTAELLAEEGFEVRTALSGGEALRIAPEFGAQLLLCDMYLPDMTGLDVIRSLRSNSATEGIHAVILTAMMDDGLARSHADGVDGFLSKPITVKAIQQLKVELGWGHETAAQQPVLEERRR